MTQQPNTDFDVEEIEPDEDEAPVVAKKVKPSVEGINAPKISIHSKVTKADMENFRPSSTRLMPDNLRGNSGGRKGLWVTAVVLLLAVAGGYKWYAPHLPDSLNFLPQEQPADQGSVMSANEVNLFAQENNPEPGASQTLGANSSTTPTSTPEQITPVSTTTPATTTPAVTAGGKKLKVNQNSVGYLNVRSEPATSAKLITKLNIGDVVEYTDLKYGWYQIVLPSGQTGWVSGQYVSVE